MREIPYSRKGRARERGACSVLHFDSFDSVYFASSRRVLSMHCLDFVVESGDRWQLHYLTDRGGFSIGAESCGKVKGKVGKER